ncbi:MAG: ROK family protein [Acidiferrobacteraceae bacterium]
MRIGIDLGGTKTEGILMTHSGEVVCRERRATPAGEGYEAIIAGIGALVRDLERDAGRTCRVGIGTPGSVSLRDGLLHNSNTTCLNGKPLQKDLERALARPVRIENDANCFALSESQDGAAAGAGVVFGVIMGTGVGGGIALNGRLHRGVHHIAGEWGHNPIEPDGPACYCGRQGCVELFLSGPGLVRDYESDSSGEGAADAAAVVARAERGEPAAEAALQRFFRRFGRALAAVINVLDPDVVVLGGGLSGISRLYTDGRAQVARHVFNEELLTPIRPNLHGDSSGVRGAARLWEPHE